MLYVVQDFGSQAIRQWQKEKNTNKKELNENVRKIAQSMNANTFVTDMSLRGTPRFNIIKFAEKNSWRIWANFERWTKFNNQNI